VKANHYGRRGALIQVVSGIEMALWDIFGKATKLPIYRLLGGAFRHKVPAYASCLFPPNPSEVIENAGQLVEKGFRGVKFGWGVFGGQSFKSDMKMVESIRKSIGDAAMMVDGGESMDTAMAIKYAHGLADFDVYFFEDPLHPDNLKGYERLMKSVSIRIAAGEAETTIYPYLDLIERLHLDVVQADTGRVGGISVMMKIAQLAYLNGVQFIPHCWNTDIVVAATLHVLAAMPQDSWMEYAISDAPLRNELCHPHFDIDREGFITIPEKPGLGVELNEEVIKKYRIH
jgi:L-rhamnonate dehydratase